MGVGLLTSSSVVCVHMCNSPDTHLCLLWDMHTCSPTHNTALPVFVYLPTWGECPPRTCEYMYLSLQYALK